MLHDLQFLIFTCLHKIHSFPLALSSEAISIDVLGSTAPNFFLPSILVLVKYMTKDNISF